MIRMLEGFIGKEEFRKGIRSYLEKYKYSNATTQDLWASFDTKVNISAFMNNWINKAGFPLVYVDEDGDDLILSQTQFLLSGKQTDILWPIPITFSWGETILMEDKELRIKKKSCVYKLNVGAYGFYRTAYKSQNLAHLLETTTNVDEKLNLINDVHALCNAKMFKAIDVIVLSELFRTEDNPEILSSVFNMLNKIRSLWYENKSVCKHINEVVMDVVGERVNEIELNNKQVGVQKAVTNSLLIANALKCEDARIKGVLSKAYENKQKVNPEYTRSLFGAVVDERDEEIYKLVFTSNVPEERIIAMSALASIGCLDKLQKTLNRYTEFEPHNSLYFFIGLSANEKNRDFILNYLCDNFDSLRAYMKNDRLFSYVIERVLCLASTQPMASKIIGLLNTKKNGEIVMAINKTIEKIECNLEFKSFNCDLEKN